MSITGELRRKMDTLGWYDEDGNIVFTSSGLPVSEIACLVINSKTFGELCDSIDAENAKLRKLAAEMYPYAKAFLQQGLMFGYTDSKSYDWFLQLREMGIEVE